MIFVDKFIWFMKFSCVCSISCDNIREWPIDKKVSIQNLQSMTPKEMIKCVSHLGKEEMGRTESYIIWSTIVKHYDGVSNVPDEVLMLLHWISVALSPEDYANITLSNIDVIQNFGFYYNLDEAQSSAIADKTRRDFAGKRPEDYTYYDLAALRQILCSFNRSEIESIHPSAYKEAVNIIGNLKKCNHEVMFGFATLAVQRDAFGPSDKWKPAVWTIIGKVADFLPKKLNSFLNNESS